MTNIYSFYFTLEKTTATTTENNCILYMCVEQDIIKVIITNTNSYKKKTSPSPIPRPGEECVFGIVLMEGGIVLMS